MMNFSITPPSIHHNFKPKKSTKVATIDWSGRRLQEMEVLPLYKEITDLNLSSNLFSTISARISAICSNLRTLNLSKNHIRQISALSFLHNLKILNLSQNQIERVEELHELVALEELNLAHNRISSFEQNAFTMNSELASLDLSYNYISLLPQLEGNFKLHFLSLNHNKIQSIGFLENSIPESVRELHLANNGIGGLEELRQLSQLTVLQELDLSGNPVLEGLKDYHINYRILTLFLLGGGQKVTYLNRSPVTQAEVEKAQKLFHRENSAQSSQEWITKLVQLIFEPQSDREPLYRYLQTVIPLHRGLKDMKTKMNEENQNLQEMMRKAVAKKKSHSPPGNRSHYVSGRQSYGQLLPPPSGPTLPVGFQNEEAMNYSKQFDEMSPIRGSYEIKRNPKYSSHTVGAAPWHGRSLDRHHDQQDQNMNRNQYYSGSPPQPQQNPSRYGNHPSFDNPRSSTFIQERKFRTNESHSYPSTMHESLMVGPTPINNSYLYHQRNNYGPIPTPASAPVGSRLRGIDSTQQAPRSQTLNSNERAQLAMMMAYQQVPASARHYQQILNSQGQPYSSPSKKSGQNNTTKNQFQISNLSPEVRKSDIKQLWEEIGKIKHYVKRLKKNHLGAAEQSKKKFVNKPIRIKYIHLDELKVSTVASPMKAKNIKNNTIKGVIKFQARVRGSLVRSRFRHFKINLRAAVKIQSFVRGCLVRKKLHKTMSPNRWSSPTKKELSYCRDMKSLLSKVGNMETEMKVLKEAKESHEKALRYLFNQLASLKRPQEADQTQAETDRVINNEES